MMVQGVPEEMKDRERVRGAVETRERLRMEQMIKSP